jgi:hypothetical protein
MFAGEPLSVAPFNEAELHDTIRHRFGELQPDLIMVYSCNVAQDTEHFPQVPRIMQFAELDSSQWGQFARLSRLPLRWVDQIEQRRVLRLRTAYSPHLSPHLLARARLHGNRAARL